MNKTPVLASSLPNRALLKRIASLLSGHVSMHLPQADSRHIRVLEGRKPAPKSSADATHTFFVTFAAPVFTASCGELSRSRLGNAQRAGLVLLLKSLDGNSLYVEVERPSKDPESIRVSTGSITGDLEKAFVRSEASEDSRRKKSEIRILRISAMHLSAVWRHIPANPDADRIVPYTANFGGVKNGRAYSFRRADRILTNSAIQIILRWYERYQKELAVRQP